MCSFGSHIKIINMILYRIYRKSRFWIRIGVPVCFVPVISVQAVQLGSSLYQFILCQGIPVQIVPRVVVYNGSFCATYGFSTQFHFTILKDQVNGTTLLTAFQGYAYDEIRGQSDLYS